MKIILIFFITFTLYAKDASVTQLFNVQTIKVKKVSKAYTKSNYGYTKKDEALTYDVSPRFSGFIEKLYANKVYMYVTKGTLLAQVYSPQVYKAKDEYLSSYRYTKNKKNHSMLKSTELKLELLGIDAKEIKELKSSKNPSKLTNIYAPHSGYIFSKTINEGSSFKAGQKLFEIVSLRELWVEVKLPEEDRFWLNEAQKFELTFKSLANKYTTTNALLYPNLDPNEATMTLRLRVKNTNNEIFPGMYTNVKSYLKEQTYLSLPKTAVIRKNSKYYVFLAGDFKGEYEPIVIDAKAIDANTYEIISGLDEGDEVVNNAMFMMDSDAQINSLY
ncbi:MAG: efflux RND transporter periplasmic adaptor subunit [Thiovulaceae bacterium]|nr:efflux RND transporter periplasmic adaptor subunit [Sulfurimonadaceae bacterium]